MQGKIIQRAWFKKHQRNGIYHYYEVYGGPGKTQDGYELVINFLNDVPIIETRHNYITDTSGLTGTWCKFETATPISEEEFRKAYNLALNHTDIILR